MAPFRASRSTRSGRPGGQTDQDIFAGLPIRQWRTREVLVSAEEQQEQVEDAPKVDDIWAERPMPKGSENYSQWGQYLLRIGRLGRTQMPVPNERKRGVREDETAKIPDRSNIIGIQMAESRDAANATPPKTTETTGFAAKRWVQLPRDQEEPEREYLAKRRKGLSSTWPGSAGPMRKTKVRRIDADGQVGIWEVLVPEGQMVDGEIRDVNMEIAGASIIAPAPGTVVAGLGVANDQGIIVASDSATVPMRRRAPPPRRKAKKGPGRGRKKLALTEGTGVSASVDDLARMNKNNGGLPPRDDDLAAPTAMEDVQEGEDEDEEEEGDEDEDNGDEGEDGEDGEDGEEDDDEGEDDDDREEGEITPSPEPEPRRSEAFRPQPGSLPAAVPPSSTFSSHQETTLAIPGDSESALETIVHASSPDAKPQADNDSTQPAVEELPVKEETPLLVNSMTKSEDVKHDEPDMDVLGDLEKHLEMGNKTGHSEAVRHEVAEIGAHPPVTNPSQVQDDDMDMLEDLENHLENESRGQNNPVGQTNEPTASFDA